MPLIYRSMLADGDKPKIGSCGKTLGVRVAPSRIEDIPVDDKAMVSPRTGGMSVAPSVAALPDFLIPARLVSRYPRARGNNKLICWKSGDGPFEEAALSDELAFRPDPNRPQKHGFVEPAEEMTIDHYQRALAATQGQWLRSEE